MIVTLHDHRCLDDCHIIMIIVVMIIVTLTRKGVAGALDKSRLHSARDSTSSRRGRESQQISIADIIKITIIIGFMIITLARS